MKKNKPKYWVVRNDGSRLFKDTVIKKLNEINHDDAPWEGGKIQFYGYNGQKRYDGTFTSNSLDRLENNPTLLDLFDFVELFMKGDEKIKAGDTVFVRDEYGDEWEKGTYIATLDRDNKSNFIVEVEGITAVHWNYMKEIDNIPEYTMEELTKIVSYDFEIKD